MTDSHSGYLITLDHDIREDDAEAIMTAIRMIKSVLSVEPVVHSHELAIAEQRATWRWERMLSRLADRARDGDPDSILDEEKQ